MKLREVLAEVRANRGIASKTLILLFRAGQNTWGVPLLGFVVGALYRLVCLVLRVDIPLDVEVGPGLVIFHPFCIAIHPDTRIGARCLLRHGVTLGARFEGNGSPIVGDDVQFGCFAVVVGEATIKSESRVRALSLTVP